MNVLPLNRFSLFWETAFARSFFDLRSSTALAVAGAARRTATDSSPLFACRQTCPHSSPVTSSYVPNNRSLRTTSDVRLRH